ncbi:hypothetical protein E2562_026149 [Oryza meyeriana var. granulata]|uniref:RNase H type-1 domain-containing protein n=1 Tax=Oryza meyeriana var. granulata TaxID=110450 RepID=A0A6G1FCK6_9ORYZ|nr:hypothetical protein E2562_026149 [Oryza meyeriana var. granulata]
MGGPRIIIWMDSQVVARQIDKSFQACHLELAKYLMAYRKAEIHFKGISVLSIPHFEIADVDALAKAATNNDPLPTHVLYEVLDELVAQDITIAGAAPAPVMAITMAPNWCRPIIYILAGHSEGAPSTASAQLRQRARGYVLVEGALYKIGICSPLL